jgi:hypothetical protein
MSKIMNFTIETKSYKIKIGEDLDGVIENEVKKYLSSDKVLDVKDLLSAYMEQTYKVLKYEKEMKSLSDSIPLALPSK